MDGSPTCPYYSQGELDAYALNKFVFQPVGPEMIRYLAGVAHSVIECDPNQMPGLSVDPRRVGTGGPREASRSVRSEDGPIPSLEDFITHLCDLSGVGTGTLMSTLVYLNRLKGRLQPRAKGLRCTAHRIFLAALILASKYLNDSSPKNKHWAAYSVLANESYSFGFTRNEVNLMEMQLLRLLEWDLAITEVDLYRQFDPFLASIRFQVQARYAREMRLHADMIRAQMDAEATYISPPPSPGRSRSRQASPSSDSARDDIPPGLYSSSSSIAGSNASRATTPINEMDATEPQPYVLDYGYPQDMYETGPYNVVPPDVPEKDSIYMQRKTGSAKQLLPYEISPEQLRCLEDNRRAKKMRGMFGRVFGTAAGQTVR